jgi:hypothetical protein
MGENNYTTKVIHLLDHIVPPKISTQDLSMWHFPLVMRVPNQLHPRNISFVVKFIKEF